MSGQEKKGFGQLLITLKKSYIHDIYKRKSIEKSSYLFLETVRVSDFWLQIHPH